MIWLSLSFVHFLEICDCASLDPSAVDDGVDEVVYRVCYRYDFLVPLEHERYFLKHSHALVVVHPGKGVGVVHYIHTAVVEVVQQSRFFRCQGRRRLIAYGPLPYVLARCKSAFPGVADDMLSLRGCYLRGYGAGAELILRQSLS